MRSSLIVLAIIAALMSLTACSSRSLLPTLEEEAAMIAAAGLNSSRRFAVVNRARFTNRAVADPRITQPLTEDMANAMQELLGVSAEALDKGREGEWSRELVESWDKAGFFETINHIRFFRQRGFDGYAIVMLESTGQSGGYLLGQPTPRESRTNVFGKKERHSESFAPQFRIYLFDNDEEVAIMRSGKNRTISCDKVSFHVGGNKVIAAEYADIPACPAKFASLFREYLLARVGKSG